MKANLLLPALLLFATGLPAQTPAPAPTNRPAFNRPNRTVPGFPGAAPAANPAAPRTVPPAAVLPGIAPELGAVTVRPPASASTVPDADKIEPAMSINWPSASVELVLEIYSEYVGRILLRPTSLNVTSSIVLKQTIPLTRLEVVQMIESALYLNKVVVVNVGDKFVTAMSTADAAKIPGAINTDGVHALPELGSIVTRVVQLKYIKPADMAQVLQAFISGEAPNPVMPLNDSGMLLLRDNVANVKRMLEMIEKVDVVAESEILSEVIPIKFAKAEEIASALSSVGGGTAGTLGTRSSSTGRTTGAGRTGAGLGNTGFNSGGNLSTVPGAQATPTPSSNQSLGDRVRSLISKAAGGDFNILGETKIIADIRSNSLLVFAAKRDMDMIKDIISKLDVVLAQVLIETIIMDVSLDNSLALGVSAAQKARDITSRSVTGAGGMNLKQFSEVGSVNNSGTNVLTDLVGNGLRYFGVIDDNVYIQLEAAASDNKINVIQKPRIQTSHATPASIFIGNTVPYVTSTYYGGGYAGGPSSQYQQLKVGIGLDVTPFINSDGLVVMQIQETIDEISGSTDITGVGAVPNTSSRQLSAEVAVNDRESIMLGGFIRNSDNKTKSGVPLLKDIPLLGALFRSSSNSKERKELVVLMRPTVLKTPSLAALQVEVEKKRLPGVVAAEKQLDKTERTLSQQEKEAEKAEQEKEARKAKTKKSREPEPDFSKPAPFTPEEELLLDSPPVHPID